MPAVAATPPTCANCRAACCHLEVILMAEDDDVPEHLTMESPAGDWVMRRSRRDGWCVALDRETMLCTIYDVRPSNCRVFEMGDRDCRAIRCEYDVDDKYGP